MDRITNSILSKRSALLQKHGNDRRTKLALRNTVVGGQTSVLSASKGPSSPRKYEGGALLNGSLCKRGSRRAAAMALHQSTSPYNKKRFRGALAIGSRLGSPSRMSSGPGTQLRSKQLMARDPLSPTKDFWKTKCQQLIHQKQRSNAELLGQRERLDWCVKEIKRLKYEAVEAHGKDSEARREVREENDLPTDALRAKRQDSK